MKADGSDVRRLTEHPGTETFPVVSPDGDRVVFASDRDGERDPRTGYRTMELYTLELGSDGSPGEVRRVTRSAGHDAHPAFSPDGEWVVFTSERAGLNDEEPLIQLATFGPQIYGEIHAVRLEDGRTARITHDKWEDGAPFWVGPAE